MTFSRTRLIARQDATRTRPGANQRGLGMTGCSLFLSVLLGTSMLGATASDAAAPARSSLPVAAAPFTGHIDADRDHAIPAWAPQVKAPAGAPNVLLILLDDVGFAASSVTGGPVAAPNLDKLASQGLLYDNFHVNALCSPTRAALLSGRNNHQVGFGTVAEAATGYPGYNTIWPRSAASIAEVLKDNGYSTAAFGKWHNTPYWQVGPAGPFDQWPTGLGFEYYYGFMAGFDSQWEPRLYRNTVPVEPWGKPADGYHLTTDLTNDAIHWLHQHDAVASDKPFFLYFATGATHEPHHVPKVWIDKYKGKFNQGWDRLREEIFARQKARGIIPASAELSSRPAELPAWDSLPSDEKRLLAHQAEVYAGFLAQTDYEVGRLLDAVRAEGKADNTLILYIVGDNGASAEGSPQGHDAHDVNGKPRSIADRSAIAGQLGDDLYLNHYSAAWAWGLDTPFQWTKQVASHLGGTTDPLIAVWPKRITEHGVVRTQFEHVTDIAPTIYAAAGITPPDTVNGVKQIPLVGTSLLPTFTDANAPSQHGVQYFEMVGNRGIYKDGWWAGSRHLLPWESFGVKWETTPVGDHPWELYHLAEDYSQTHDLAAKNPDKLKEMVALFDEEAKKYKVYPIAPHYGPQPSIAGTRTHFEYRGDVVRVTQQQLPHLRFRPFTLTATVEAPEGGGNGVVVADGGHLAGIVMYLQDGKPVFESTAFGNIAGRIVAPQPLGAGHNEISATITPDEKPTGDAILAALINNKPEPATVELKVNGATVATGKIANLTSIYDETLDIGRDLGSPVSPAYAAPASYTGKIDLVALDLH